MAKFHNLKTWTKSLILIGSSILTVAITAGSVYGISYGIGVHTDFDVESSVSVPETNEGDIEACFQKGRGIYDKDGNAFTMKGVNFGNWLIQEGWMSVNSLGPALKEDGSYQRINEDGIIEDYVEVYQEEFDQALKDNPNLTEEQIEELYDTYYYSYCQEEDFRNIKALGFNTIRLPMYYGNFMEGPLDNLRMKEDAFELVDYFLENCKKYDLFCVLDMHGTIGGQSGYEHSGTRSCDLWTNEVYQDEMATLWQNIARHYTTERKDLSYTIVCYDLINEPTDREINGTGKQQWDVFDKIYQAIREVDQKHIICLEGVWEFSNLPNHTAYGWENIIYEFHFYNWMHSSLSNDSYYAAMNAALGKADCSVPFYIGEFTFFDEKDEWVKWLSQYDEWNYSWTFWNYKIISVGYWDTSWGLYVNRMNLVNEQLKLDVRTATYDEIHDVWSKQATSESYQSTGVLYEAIQAYNETKKNS